MNIRVAAAALVAASAAGAIAPASASPQTIRISGDGCASALTVSIQNARLSEALDRLAEKLGFDVHFEDSVDPVITREISGSGTVVLKALLESSGRYMLLTAPDVRCRERRKVSSVWLVSMHEAAPSPSTARSVSSGPSRSNAAVQRPTLKTPAELAQLRSEESRRRKQRYDDHIAAYGKPPPDMEEDASHGLEPAGSAPN
jgi:hypothetical protein